eukprot:CAMPEP_0183309732 /NCGR_PEP_ID=MMETSP0160_2-20130417/25513_1 /TAXON_ID=2839 ORGANISM="Odontella Sinensis, Strain Grunow 1884" /NCGR_SAMPLE_ID=MMETSP0160_2 /ASSEMBLY_ACC=CAM_ASM_000250 /LENGTH=247 /DNA_ID=CAMNT_0025473801 /DNA_START=27 /DNA_END=767 /DNA_ORIENTATION=-
MPLSKVLAATALPFLLASCARCAFHSHHVQRRFLSSQITTVADKYQTNNDLELLVTRRHAFAAEGAEGEVDVASDALPVPLASRIKGVIFDMDGTITKHCIDFADMRLRIYSVADEYMGPECYSEECVLELYQKFPPEGQAVAKDVFNDIEEKAIKDMSFQDGLADLCRHLDERGLRRAVLTRNVARSVDAMHDLLLETEGLGPFYPVVSRDTTRWCEQRNEEVLVEAKPAPDGILHICSLWGCDPA